MAPTQSQILEIANTTRNTANGWTARKLIPEYDSQSRDYALHLYFMSALTKVGFSAVAASGWADEFVTLEGKRKLHPWFMYQPDTERPLFTGNKGAESSISNIAHTLSDDIGRMVMEGEDSISELDKSNPCTCYAVINLAEIVKRVDEAFGK